MAKKKTESYEESQLYKVRHSTAHIMAQAITAMFDPGEVKVAIGPPIADGFYYDFELPRQLTPQDFLKIEKRMRRIMQGKHVFDKKVVSAAEAKKIFKDQPYKIELIEGLEKGGVDEYGNPTEEIPEISVYTQDGFTDLCRGPHVKNTSEINPSAFKLMNMAGAYWRGDEKNQQLQRVYGTAWETSEKLEQHLWRLDEAKKRDHRKLGKELGLFYFSDDIGPGIPLFTPKGEILRRTMEDFVRETQTRYGYEHVWTGNLVKEDLYHKSGHYENYKDSMFPPMVDDNVSYRLKPMNCPSHMTLYKEMGLHSYRELPMRFSEFATLYRYEKSGELSGLSRVRALTQDDCHIFCTPDQIKSEFTLALNLIREVLARYQFDDYRVDLSLKGEEGKYVDAPEKWIAAESVLREALEENKVEYTEAYGEAAFYGPKADFIAKDVLGREWQLSTIQVDFIQPERLGLTYIGEDNAEHTPVVIHRAVTGTTERFMATIIEHFAGAFPVWLAPVQAVLIPIADRHIDYADKLAAQFKAEGLRVEVYDNSDRMGAKIRLAQKQKVPYMLVIGDKELESEKVALRLRSGEDEGAIAVDAFITRAKKDIEAAV
jgi:threonyl-tRNA synthetase